MTKRGIIYACIIGSLIVLAWLLLRHRARKVDGDIASVQLPQEDTEKLIVNQHSHTITIVKRGPNGTTETSKTFLSPVASVEVRKDGTVKVNSRQWGTEMAPAVGILYGSDFTLRAAGTLGLLYYKRYEFSAGLGVGTSIQSARALVAVTYNAYDALQIGGYIDNQRHAGVIALLRF